MHCIASCKKGHISLGNCDFVMPVWGRKKRSKRTRYRGWVASPPPAAGSQSEIHGMCLSHRPWSWVESSECLAQSSPDACFWRTQYQSVHVPSRVGKLADQAHSWSWNLKIYFCTLQFFFAEWFICRLLKTKKCFSLLLKWRNNQTQRMPLNCRTPGTLSSSFLCLCAGFSLHSCACSPFFPNSDCLCLCFHLTETWTFRLMTGLQSSHPAP